jgi:nucleotide-binding universal stress UspA family protein
MFDPGCEDAKTRCGNRKEPRMYRLLMVPLDGGSFGEYALPYALGIARRSGATVQLVHVCAPSPPAATDDQRAIGAETPQQPRHEHAATYLRALATSLAERWDVGITTALLEGPVADTLYAHALASRADLVVMATHGHGPLPRIGFGSVADTLVHQLPIPTLLVRPHEQVLDLLESVHEHVFQHVLIPLDGSALAEAIVKHAVGLGTLMNAEYTLLQAIDPLIGEHTVPPYGVGISRAAFEEVRAEAQGYLERVAGQLRARSVQVQTQLVVAEPAAAILEYAREHAVDLIAIATHGRGGLGRVLLGSVADAVLRGAGAPILLYRPPAEAARVTYASRGQTTKQGVGVEE